LDGEVLRPEGEYDRRLRELLVAALDFSRVRSYRSADDWAGFRRDIVLAAEHLSEKHLADVAPEEGAARVAWAALAEDIAGCAERGQWDRLRPTAEAVRVVFGWWFDLWWVGRAWYCLWGGRVPRPGGRPLRQVGHAEPGAAPDGGGRSGFWDFIASCGPRRR
jgi:hypothetical protein